MKKKPALISTIAAVVAISGGLVFSGNTEALWSDATSISAVSINTGNLDTQKIGAVTWVDKTTTTPVPIADISNFKTAPNDVLVGTQKIDVVLDGDNALAAFSVKSITPTGTLVSDINGVKLTFDVLDKNQVPVLQNIPYGQETSWINISQSDISNKIFDNVPDYTVVIKAAFDPGTPGMVNMANQSIVKGATVTVKQTRGALT